MISKVVIFGASGHAQVIVDMIENNPKYELVGFIDKYKNIQDTILNYQVIGDEESLPKLMTDYGFNKGVVGIGDNFTRSKVTKKILESVPDFHFINCIHNSANISKYCNIGYGNVIMAGVTINSETVISNHCVLNTNSSLDHDCSMKNFSSLAPNSAVGGNCIIGEYSNIGIGASVFHGTKIGNNCVIGGGSVVTKDTKSNSTYVGSPAKLISDRKIDDKYL